MAASARSVARNGHLRSRPDRVRKLFYNEDEAVRKHLIEVKVFVGTRGAYVGDGTMADSVLR